VITGPDFRLDGKVALLTGAGRGIGAAIAEGLASAGCAVAIQDIDLEAAQSAVHKINSAGGKAIALGGDICDLSLAAQLVGQTIQGLGGIHILINNAAIQQWIAWTELTPEEIEQKHRANVMTPLLLIQQAVPHFKAANYGRVINLGSIQQRRGNGVSLAYSMTKAALVNMTTTIAMELASTGITVNMIAPGYFNTYRNRGDFKDQKELEERGKFVPMGHVGEPRECAGAALMLCSPAGAYITGQCINVDGGMSAR
jgi:NAD(P)-dependent dehydrogenase (short-subunit alcohol dehydrogenase family)